MSEGIGEKIKTHRLRKGVSQKKLAEMVGIHPVTLSRIEKGKLRNPSFEVVSNIASALGIEIEELISDIKTKVGDVDDLDRLPVYRVPLINFVQAGEFHEYSDLDYPNGWADEFVYCTEKGPHVFALKIKGSSMEPDFNEGDIVVINPDKQVNHGDSAVVKLLNTGETTIKKVEFFYQGKLILLRPINHSYKPIEIKEEDRDSRIRIIGRVMEVIRKL